MARELGTVSRSRIPSRLPVVLLCLGLPALLGVRAGTAGCVPDDSEPDDTCLFATAALRDGDVRALSFCDDAEDWVGFNACAGRAYTIRTFDLAPAADTVLELYGGDCQTLLALDDDGGGGRASLILWTAPADGTYHVRVRQADGSSGPDRDYRLSLVGNTAACSVWSRTYSGAAGDERGHAIAQAADGGLVVAGTAASWGAGGTDGWIVKLDPAGEVVWERTYGTTSNEFLVAIEPAADGGYFAAGVYAGPLWVLKVDAAGAVVWERTLGAIGAGGNLDSSVLPTADGGCLVAKKGLGLTIFRLNANGQILWQQRAASAETRFTPLRPTRDGGFVFVAGQTDGEDATLRKFASDGSLIWRKRYNAFWPLEGIYDVRQLADGGFVLANTVRVSIPGEQVNQVSVLRVDALGEIVWYRIFDIDGCGDGATRVVESVDGDIVFLARGRSRNMAGFCQSAFCWVARLSVADGAIQTQAGYGQFDSDECRSLDATLDGGVAVAGRRLADDLWVLRLDADLESCSSDVDGSGAALATTMSELSTDALPTSTAALSVTSQTAASTADPAVLCSGVAQAGASEVSPPGAAQPLEFLDAVTLRWEEGALSGSDQFNLYRGSLSDLPGSYGACLESAIPTNHTTNSEEPPVGWSWFYLVTGDNSTAEGPMGIRSDGQARENEQPCP